MDYNVIFLIDILVKNNCETSNGWIVSHKVKAVFRIRVHQQLRAYVDLYDQKKHYAHVYNLR